MLCTSVSPPASVPASPQRGDTFLWAAGAALGLADDDDLRLQAVFGLVLQVAQGDPLGAALHHKQLLQATEETRGCDTAETCPRACCSSFCCSSSALPCLPPLPLHPLLLLHLPLSKGRSDILNAFWMQHVQKTLEGTDVDFGGNQMFFE